MHQTRFRHGFVSKYILDRAQQEFRTVAFVQVRDHGRMTERRQPRIVPVATGTMRLRHSKLFKSNPGFLGIKQQALANQEFLSALEQIHDEAERTADSDEGARRASKRAAGDWF